MGTFIDLRKASDHINQRILTEKQEAYVASKVASSLITSHRQHRKQLVYYNTVPPYTAPIKNGVPQGGVLGPSDTLIIF